MFLNIKKMHELMLFIFLMCKRCLNNREDWKRFFWLLQWQCLLDEIWKGVYKRATYPFFNFLLHGHCISCLYTRQKWVLWLWLCIWSLEICACRKIILIFWLLRNCLGSDLNLDSLSVNFFFLRFLNIPNSSYL